MPARDATRLVATIAFPVSNNHASLIRKTGSVTHGSDDMVAELDNDRYFRWFDSGDVYSLKLAEKILAVMQATPWVKHWLPTRMHKFIKFHAVFAAMESLPNVVVRYSSDSVTGEVVAGRNTSTIVSSFKTMAMVASQFASLVLETANAARVVHVGIKTCL
jgi:hypothetical protein